jgi:metal-dependent phosphohydrolase
MRDLPEDEEQVHRLFILYRSDVTSKNPKRRAKIRRTIDRLEAAMARVKAADERQAARPALDGHDVMEMFNLTPGRRLGEVMRFLNSDEGIRLGRAEAVEAIRSRFPSLESESSSSVTGNTDGSGVW